MVRKLSSIEQLFIFACMLYGMGKVRFMIYVITKILNVSIKSL